MRELLIERDLEVPLVQFRWLFMQGSASDKRNEEGLCNYSLELFRRGNASRSREEINRFLAETCSTISVQISDEVSTFSALLPSQALNEFTKRLTEILSQCAPDEEEIEGLKKEIIEEQSVSLENPSNRCSYLLRRALFEEDSYGNYVLGQPSTINSFTAKNSADKRNDLLNQSSYLVLGGDVSQVQGQAVSEELGIFSQGDSNSQKCDNYKKIEGSRLALCHDANQEQATVLLSWTSDSWNREDFARTQMLEKILCKDYTSNLCQDFRQRAGLTYGIGGAHRNTLRGNQFICRYQTASKFGPHFLEDLLGVFSAFARGEGSYSIRDQDGGKIQGEVDLYGETLERCRKKILKSMPFLSYGPQAKLARRLEEILYDSPIRDEKWLRKRYTEMTGDDLKEMSQQLFSTSGIVVTIVDNMEKNGEAYRQLQDWTKISKILDKKSMLCGQIF